MFYTTIINIPSLKEHWQFRPITTADQKELCRLLLNTDNIDVIFNSTVNYILSQCADTKHDTSRLTLIDKIVILLKLRCESIGLSIELEVEKDSKKYNIDYNFLQKYHEFVVAAESMPSLVIETLDLKIQCNVPNIETEIDFNNRLNKTEVTYEELIPFFIEFIKIQNQTILLKTLSIEDRYKIIQSFPAKINNQIINYIKNVFLILNSVKIYSYLDEDISFNFGSSYTNYIKFILRDDLYKIYQEIYVLNKKINFSSEYIEKLSPLEREMYVSFLRQENQQSAPAQNMSNNPTTLPVPAVDSFDSFAQEMGG